MILTVFQALKSSPAGSLNRIFSVAPVVQKQ
jgi:hypothetical protein